MFARLLIFAILFSGIYFLIKLIIQSSSNTVRCSRCEGKGYWYGAREREKCDWCKGSGRLPRQ